MSIDSVVNKLIELGIDLGTKDAVISALRGLNADTSLIDDVYIGLKNHLNFKSFSRVPRNERVLFLPQCLRNSEKCTAELTDTGYVCKRCGACSINRILDEADRLGYRSYIVPGGSMVFNISEEIKPRACVGVGCYSEVEEAMARFALIKIPTQGIPLSKAGCKDTVVDVERVFKILNI